MMILTLTMLLNATPLPSNTITQLRETELAERLASTEAKRLQIELQIAQTKQQIAALKPKPAAPSKVLTELERYQLVGIVANPTRTYVLLRYREQLIRLVNGEMGPLDLLAEVNDNRVRLSQFGHFRDLPLLERW